MTETLRVDPLPPGGGFRPVYPPTWLWAVLAAAGLRRLERELAAAAAEEEVGDARGV